MSPTPRHGRHAALLDALLASALTVVTAQPAPPGGGYDDDYVSGQGQQQAAHVSTAMVALLVGVIAVFLFIAFSTIYLRHCSGAYAVRSDADGRRGAAPLDHRLVSWSWSRWQQQRRRQRPRGLDADVVEAFPTMKYAEAKALRVGTKQQCGGALECAVCLSEFEDEDRLRLLSKCSHAFHPDCIGEWLAGHVTCPVCRCNLDPNKDAGSDDDEQPSFATALTTNSVDFSSQVVAAAARQDGGGALPVAVVIDVVTAEEEEERRREAAELQQIGSQRRAMRRSRSLAKRPVATQLARSHSTGHSLAVRLDRDLERFTLRLPEHVRREMVAAAAAGEHSRRGRRAAGKGRSAPLGRWQSVLAGTFSGKLSFFSASRTGDSGEVSSSSSTRVRGKRVAAIDVPDVPAKGGLRLDRIGGSPSGGKAGTVPHGAAADVEKAVTQ